MNCDQLESILDDFISGELEAKDAKAVAEHHLSCESCHHKYLETLELRALLQQLPVPRPSADFAQAALDNAVARQGRSGPLTAFGGAIAAGLAAWFIVTSILFTTPHETAPAPAAPLITVSAETRTIKLAIESEMALDHVEMSIELTPNLELAGFGTRHQINWNTRLKQGTNLIRLPITGLAAGNGEITTRVRMNGKEKIMRIQTLYKSPGHAWQIIRTGSIA